MKGQEEKHEVVEDVLSVIEGWNCQHVRQWLAKHGYEKYASFFEREKLDGKSLLLLKEEDLLRYGCVLTEQNGKIAPIGDVKRLFKLISDELILPSHRNHSTQNDRNFNGQKYKYYLNHGNKNDDGGDGDGDTKKYNNNDDTSGGFGGLGNDAHANSEAGGDEDISSIFETMRWVNGDKGSFYKLIFSIGFLLSVCFITALVMTAVHERVPNASDYPPLPDIFLDNIKLIPWAFSAVEYIIFTLSAIFATVALFHKHRFVVLRRFCAIAGTVFFLRCITMFVTALSVPGLHLKCEKLDLKTLDDKLRHAWVIFSNFGLHVKGVRTCGDYMFSGHTSVVTLLSYFIREYLPRKWKGFRVLIWTLNIIAMFFVLAAHEHYSIDVLIAFFISSRLFDFYHTVANNLSLQAHLNDKNKSTKRKFLLLQKRPWLTFFMFQYLEEHTDSVVPNEYNSLRELLMFWKWECVTTIANYLTDHNNTLKKNK